MLRLVVAVRASAAALFIRRRACCWGGKTCRVVAARGDEGTQCQTALGLAPGLVAGSVTGASATADGCCEDPDPSTCALLASGGAAAARAAVGVVPPTSASLLLSASASSPSALAAAECSCSVSSGRTARRCVRYRWVERKATAPTNMATPRNTFERERFLGERVGEGLR